MEKPRAAKSALSNGVLQMKFMKRSAIRVEKEQNEAEIKPIDDEHWVLDIPDLAQKENKYQHEPSYSRCEQLKFGRMSYRGFNPEIEKLMKTFESEAELVAAEEREKETSVGDEEMASRYSSLFGTMAKKFTGKRRHKNQTEEEDDVSDGEEKETRTQKKEPSKKKKFKKPSD